MKTSATSLRIYSYSINKLYIIKLHEKYQQYPQTVSNISNDLHLQEQPSNPDN